MVNPSPVKTSIRLEDRFISAFEMQQGHTLNGSNAAVQRIRAEAIQSFETLGIPTRKLESWKYTNIEKLLRHEFSLTTGPRNVETLHASLESLRIGGLDAHIVVLLDGRFSAEASTVGTLPAGAIICGFRQATESHPEIVNRHFARYADHRSDSLTALNTAFTHDGAFVYVPDNIDLEQPVHVLHVISSDDDVLIQPRSLVVTGRSSRLTLIETHHRLSDTRTLTNAVMELFAGENATVDCCRVQDEGDSASQVNKLQVYQTRHSNVTVNTITLSGEIVRNDLQFMLDAEDCEAHLYGLFLGKDDMHVDNHTLVDHARPNCLSNELYKGVLNDASTGVFNGKVYVHRDAQQTNAYQSNKSIVLTDTARMYSKPELEIYADDVKCSHGATTGQLDREALFYLRSRGFTERHARTVLLLAFARDVTDNIKVDPLRVLLDEKLRERFHD